MTYKPHINCRCCNSTNMTSYLDLGMMPMANDLKDTYQAAVDAERFPLKVLFCEDCGLSQLSIVVDPEVMFRNYAYRSSINTGYRNHCRQMAVEFKDKYNLHTSATDFGSLVIDIAGNDGALLSEFCKEIPGIKHLNVDPARNLDQANKDLGVRQFCRFWNMETAIAIEGLGWPKADVITATNVFAHVDDVKGFIDAAKYALKPEGVLILEFPYLIDFIEKGEWDTVYFEHLSYWSIGPLVKLVMDCKMKVIDVQKFDIHGGTVRVTITPALDTNIRKSVWDFIHNEAAHLYNEFKAYSNYRLAVNKAVKSFLEGINSLTGTVACFAASAKGNTLLNKTGAGKIEFIVDETPEKIGRYTPGNGLKVITIAEMMLNPPDYMIILSWNFIDEITAKLRAAGYQGKFINPIPEWKQL